MTFTICSHISVSCITEVYYIQLEFSCNKYSNLIGQLEVPYFTYTPPGEVLYVGLMLGCQGQRKMQSATVA